MNTKTTLIIAAVLILAATLTGVLLWNQLPEQMASHWGANDQVNGTMSKFWGVFLMPVVTIAMLLLFLVIPSIDPLKANIQQFREYFNTFIVLTIAFMIYVHVLTLIWNLGYTSFRMSGALLPSSQEFFKSYGLTPEKLLLAKPDCIVMHPGPINRGRELSSEVADSQRSMILNQVGNGIAVRMAVLERVLLQ